jgi:arsenate reductase (thioredoxin)
VTARRLPRALFICVQNAGRSQIAQAFWQQLGGDARSAGSRPAARLHPEVVAAMRESGIDLSDRVPRPLTDSDAAWAEVVVAMGCGDECPYVPGRSYVDWELDDPADGDPVAVRAIRDEIHRRVIELALVVTDRSFL